ncbi:proteasome subunit alpha type-1-like [Anopheles aquasalis]|uniref:proteasome subunit alpha type-1-like n=1 Tax=Anopheles aquasalis TaxID=42839 RepID=UPI00215B1E8B|nr:proteasome subunit alpha type-1-like [Anopheles aquasalis]
MFRNQYDSDVTVWSPQGRLHQVEYAMEAVKLGSATVGLKNKEYAVLIALKRASSELSSYQKKIISVDDHLGLSFAGITADARILSRYLRQECLNYKYAYDAFYPVGRLISTLGNKMQVCTQRYDRRPYGVGLLVIGFDDQGPHIYQTCPSANFFDCKAMSIGSRSQSARTYLEKHLNTFSECTKDELIRHGVQALQDTLPNEVDLNTKNISIAIVGKDEKFTILSEEDNDKYLNNIVRRGGGASEVAGGNQAPRDDGDDQPPNVPADPIPIVAMET